MPQNEYSTMDDFQVVKEKENEQKNAKALKHLSQAPIRYFKKTCKPSFSKTKF